MLGFTNLTKNFNDLRSIFYKNVIIHIISFDFLLAGKTAVPKQNPETLSGEESSSSDESDINEGKTTF